jgi:hypothetical protein
LFVVRVQSNRCACATCADRDRDSHAVCFDSCTHKDDYTNMDKNTNKRAKRDKYPYIDFDEDGNAYVVTERDAIPYTYATDDSSREKYPDAASIDTITPGKRGERGGLNANRRNADPDCNGNA